MSEYEPTSKNSRRHVAAFETQTQGSLGDAAIAERLRQAQSYQTTVVNSASAAVDSAVAGHGVTRVMSYQAADAVAAGKLVVLLAQHEPPPIPVHLVLPAGRSGTAKQRAFAAFAAPRLREALAQAAEQICPGRLEANAPPTAGKLKLKRPNSAEIASRS